MPTTYDNHLPADRSALGNLRVDIAENSAGATDQDVNLDHVSGQAQTARDWSLDLAQLQNLDIAITALRDALRGTSSKTLTDLESHLASIQTTLSSALDATMSTRATEATLATIAGKDFATQTTLAAVKTDADSIPLIKAKTDNIDIAVSALRDALRGVSNKTLTDIVTALANVANVDVALSTRATETTLSWVKGDTAKLDTALSVLAILERFGRNIAPAWTHGAETTAPAGGSTLVSKAVTVGKTGYVYGFYITSGEDNDFTIGWTSGASGKSMKVVHASKGTTLFTDKIPVNEGLGADASTNMSVKNVNAGNAGIKYSAGILTGEI